MDYGWAMIDRQSVGSLAAMIIEPILSTGGILDPPKGYLTRMKSACEQRGMLLIIDEAQTGLGRTGDMFAFQYEDNFVPDILCLSKTLGSGLPLSSVSTTTEIEQRCNERGFMWLTTHYNDPLPAAVGDKVLEIVVRDKLWQRARDRGNQLLKGLHTLQKKYWCVGDIRGRGLLLGMEVISNRVTRTPGVALGQTVSEWALSHGLSCNIITYPGMGGVIRLAPPVTVTAEEIDEGVGILDRAFEYALSLSQLKY